MSLSGCFCDWLGVTQSPDNDDDIQNNHLPMSAVRSQSSIYPAGEMEQKAKCSPIYEASELDTRYNLYQTNVPRDVCMLREIFCLAA